MKTTGMSFRQIRNVSGFSRPMSVWDAFIYNFLAMGVIFPWTYLWGAACFPGGRIDWAIGLALVAQVPISLAYCILSAVLPVTGGDYIYQTRAFGKWGFIAVMSGFVIWILQWVALSGWLLATLGLAPLMLCIGVYGDLPAMSRLALLVQSPWGIVTISLLLALFTTWFLIRGLQLYVRVQKFLFLVTLLSIGAVVYVYFLSAHMFSNQLDHFVAKLVAQLGSSVPPAMASGFATFVVNDVAAAGANLSPPFSFLATLAIVPIAWTSLQWATYSVEQNTEIAEADRFGKQFYMLVLSAVSVAFLLWLVAYAEYQALPVEFINAVSVAYWSQKGSPETVAFLKGTLQPFPNVLAMAASGGILCASLIAVGFLANAFQITCNCFIGVTRILVAMSTDGAIPQKLGLGKVDSRLHSPVRAHWAYFLASIPCILCYNLISSWSNYTLGVTFACGYVFTLSSLAATRIPTKMRGEWSTSEVSGWSAFRIRSIGYAGFVMGASMVLAYLIFPQLGLTGNVPYMIVFGVIAFAYIIYYLARLRSPLLDKKFQKSPEEIIHFYRKGNSE